MLYTYSSVLLLFRYYTCSFATYKVHFHYSVLFNFSYLMLFLLFWILYLDSILFCAAKIDPYTLHWNNTNIVHHILHVMLRVVCRLQFIIMMCYDVLLEQTLNSIEQFFLRYSYSHHQCALLFTRYLSKVWSLTCHLYLNQFWSNRLFLFFLILHYLTWTPFPNYYRNLKNQFWTISCQLFAFLTWLTDFA